MTIRTCLCCCCYCCCFIFDKLNQTHCPPYPVGDPGFNIDDRYVVRMAFCNPRQLAPKISKRRVRLKNTLLPGREGPGNEVAMCHAVKAILRGHVSVSISDIRAQRPKKFVHNTKGIHGNKLINLREPFIKLTKSIKQAITNKTTKLLVGLLNRH